MRRYETIVILDPDISEDERTPVFNRVSDTIAQGNGLLVELDEWGNRKLAYEIKKKPRGHYTRIDFCGSGSIVNEIERFFRIDDRIMKYLTVLLDENADVDQLKEDIARTESEKSISEPEQPEQKEEVEAAEDEPPTDTAKVEAATEAQAESEEAVTTESESNDTEPKKED